MYIGTNERTVFLPKTKTTTVSLSIVCFGALYFIYLLKRTYLVSSNALLFNILDFAEWPIYIFVFLNALIRDKYKKRDLITIAVVGIVFLLGYAATSYAELLKAMMIIVSLKNVNYKKLFDSMYQILAVSIVLTILLYMLGLSNAGVQRRGANALGYAQANSVGYVLMALTLLTVAKCERVSLQKKVLLALLNLLGFIIADSRTGFLLACIALLFSNDRIYTLIKRKRFIQSVLAVLPVILIVLTIMTSVLYESSTFVQGLDLVFNARIAMNYYILSNIGITLFGQPVEYHGLTTEAIYNPVKKTWAHFMTIDSTYMCLLIEFGLLATIVVIIAYSKLIKKLIRHDAIRVAFVMTILSLYGFIESSVLSIFVAFPFALLLNERIKIDKTNAGAEYDT